MLQLEIFRDRQLVATQPLRPGDLTIGRDPKCDIVLDDPMVSRTHARLHIGEGEFVIEDLSGKNGILVKDKKVSRVVMQHGTTVRVGRHYLRLCLGGLGLKGGKGGDVPPEHLDRPTVVISTGETLLAGAPSWSLRDPCLSWDERGVERVVLLDRDRVTLGPGKDADVPLHLCGPPQTPLAEVTRTAHGFALARLGPKGCVKVNDRSVDHRALKDGDLLAIGEQVVVFHWRG